MIPHITREMTEEDMKGCRRRCEHLIGLVYCNPPSGNVKSYIARSMISAAMRE